MDKSRIRVKMGEIEVECEGSEEFLRDELRSVLEAVSRLYNESGAVKPPDKNSQDEDSKKQEQENGGVVGTTATLSGKLKVKSGNDLIIAAAAHLTFVAKKAEFSRAELLEQVKGATGYFKESYSKNLSNYITSRVKSGQLLEPRTGHYALGATEADRLRTALAT